MLHMLWLIFFMVLIKLLIILETIYGKIVFFFLLYLIHLDLHSFPTRRSSDLKGKDTRDYLAAAFPELNAWERAGKECRSESGSAGMPRPISYAVFCLKKKNKPKIPHPQVSVTEARRDGRHTILLGCRCLFQSCAR